MTHKARLLGFILSAVFLHQIGNNAHAAPGDIHTVAGIGVGDYLAATSAVLKQPSGVAVDVAGNIYVADSDNNRIRKVDAATGIITTIAGNGYPGYGGDDGPAPLASLYYPTGVAIDAAGNVYIADGRNARIRKVDGATGVITTVAGNGSPGFSGDDGPAILSSISEPGGVAVDASGNIYIADTWNIRIRKVDGATGIITTVAGNGSLGFSGDDGPATLANISVPRGVAVDASGNIYIADTDNARIRKVDGTTGIITTVAGNGSFGYSGDDGPATQASLGAPRGVVVDALGTLYIADTGNVRIRKVDASTGVITTVAGDGNWGDFGDNGPAISANLNNPSGIGLDALSNMYIADTGNNRIRKVDKATGTIIAFAGNGSYGYSGDNGPATAASLNSPQGITADHSGNVYLADTYNHRIRKVDGVTGVIITVAGNGTSSYSGDNGPAILASLNAPAGLALDASENILIADASNNRIRKIDSATGVISTIAGNGTYEYTGDNGPAILAGLECPHGVAIDGSGNIYIADTCSNRIRRVDAATSVITTVAGTGGCGYSGDNGPATSASLCSPSSVAVDASGNIYIADGANHRIRKINSSTGVITTMVGNATYGCSGDNGPAISATLAVPYGLSIDASGNIYLSDLDCMRVRKVDSGAGTITTVAGDGTYGYSGDDGPATSATLARPMSVHVDTSGNIYIADSDNSRIRMVEGYDIMPDAFSFTDQTGVPLATIATSNVATVSGINTSSPISITSGEYDINQSGMWTTAAGTVNNGDTVRVRQTSSTQYSTTTDAILIIGGVSGTFRVTTLANIPPPTVVITSPSADITNNSSPLLTYTVSDGTVTVKVDDVIVPKVSGDTLDPLTDGSHTVRVESTNAAGNTGFSEVTFTVDTVPPAVGINPVISPTKYKFQLITGTREKNTIVQVSVNTSAKASRVVYLTDTIWSCLIIHLVQGDNYVTAAARDAAGNTAIATANIVRIPH